MAFENMFSLGRGIPGWTVFQVVWSKKNGLDELFSGIFGIFDSTTKQW